MLHAFGLPTDAADLARGARFLCRAAGSESHITRVFELAGISEVVMTNDPLDPDEAPLWEQGAGRDPRFHPVLRLDRILNKWADHWSVLAAQGYAVDRDASGRSVAEVRRFLADWCERMRPVYMAVSLPDTFAVPRRQRARPPARRSGAARLPRIRHPAFADDRRALPGESALQLAGDGVGQSRSSRRRASVRSSSPDNRFLISVLSRENQHELCVYARKFANLMPFGCWWFLNNPSIVEEITRERLEMLGATFIPQHSDARVLEQVIYKWRNTRADPGADSGRDVPRSCRRWPAGDARRDPPGRHTNLLPHELRAIRGNRTE